MVDSITLVGLKFWFQSTMVLPTELVAYAERELGRKLAKQELDSMEIAWNSTGRRPWNQLYPEVKC